MASRRPSDPSSCAFAAIRSAGVCALSSVERALAMSPNTVCSCAAYPFTVSTRLGIKSARRCSTTSTCDHSAETAWFFTTIWLRRPTYIAPIPSATTPSNTNAVHALFMHASSDAEPTHLQTSGYATATKSQGREAIRSRSGPAAVDLFRYLHNQIQISRKDFFQVHLSACAFSFAKVHDAMECRCLQGQQRPKLIGCGTIGRRRFLAYGDQRMPKERTKG